MARKMAAATDWTGKEHTFDCAIAAYPQLSATERRAVTRAKCVRKAARELPEIDAQISDIVPTQDWVHRDAVEALRDVLPTIARVKEPAIAVLKNGKMWLFDGHHRLVASLLAGVDVLRVRVLDFDAASAAV